MDRETLWVNVTYGIALAFVAISTFEGAILVLSRLRIGGIEWGIGLAQAGRIALTSALIIIIALVRLVQVIRSKGLAYIPSTSTSIKFLRTVSLILLVVCAAYKVLTLGAMLLVPGLGLMSAAFDNLFPVALSVVLFEASRLAALEHGVVSPNLSMQPTGERHAGG
jgi:hypothetical protein